MVEPSPASSARRSTAPAPTPADRPRGRLVPERGGLDRQAVGILVSVPLLLVGVEYLGIQTREWFWHIFPPPPPEWAPYRALLPQLWWVGVTLVFNLVLPLGFAWGCLGLGPGELGFRVRGTTREAWAYPLLYLLVLPFVVYASGLPGFLATYPLYPDAGRSVPIFLAWEAAYALQFVTVEFFYRGYMVLGLRPRLGPYAVLVMLGPYGMIHFHKPWQEAVGAVVAGIVLGTLAYRTRSVVYGILLHYGVALTMDLLVLWRAGRLAF